MKIRGDLSTEATRAELVLAALHELGPASVREIATWIGDGEYQPRLVDTIESTINAMRRAGVLYIYSGSRTPLPGAPRKGQDKRWWITAHRHEVEG